MAARRASLASDAAFRSSASSRCFVPSFCASGSLHAGHRLAKPGLFGFSSNSSEHTTHTFTGNTIRISFYANPAQVMARCVLCHLRPHTPFLRPKVTDNRSPKRGARYRSHRNFDRPPFWFRCFLLCFSSSDKLGLVKTCGADQCLLLQS